MSSFVLVNASATDYCRSYTAFYSVMNTGIARSKFAGS
jgi:hypothetical protein